MSAEDEGRVLTLEQLRKAGACEKGRAVFRKTWGTKAVVNQEWARQANAAYNGCEYVWASKTLLPSGWDYIFDDVRFSAATDGAFEKMTIISWAVFAALYVEAGKP